MIFSALDIHSTFLLRLGETLKQWRLPFQFCSEVCHCCWDELWQLVFWFCSVENTVLFLCGGDQIIFFVLNVNIVVHKHLFLPHPVWGWLNHVVGLPSKLWAYNLPIHLRGSVTSSPHAVWALVASLLPERLDAWKGSLRVEGFISPQSALLGQAGGREQEAAGHVCPQTGSRERWVLVLASFSLFCSVWNASLWHGITVFRVSLPTGANPIWNSLTDTPRSLFPWWWHIPPSWQSRVAINSLVLGSKVAPRMAPPDSYILYNFFLGEGRASGV